MLFRNGDLFEQTCRIIMKMLHFSNADISDYEEKVSTKKKKKKGGIFSSLFKNWSHNIALHTPSAHSSMHPQNSQHYRSFAHLNQLKLHLLIGAVSPPRPNQLLYKKEVKIEWLQRLLHIKKSPLGSSSFYWWLIFDCWAILRTELPNYHSPLRPSHKSSSRTFINCWLSG